MSRPPSVRLDRLLANMGYGSRREVQRLIAEGGVVLDGAPIRDAGHKTPLAPDLADRMTVRGQRLDPPAPLTLILHKPLGVVCSHREPGRSVYDLLPARWRARDPLLSTVGRLDLDTSGLLLITDDGPLLHKVISPRARIEKRYLAELARPLRGDEGAAFAAGTLMLDGEDRPLEPARLQPLSPTRAYLTITEGRYHQVRRMFAAVGNHVAALHRDRIGGLALAEDLAPGRYCIAAAADLEALFSPGDAGVEAAATV